MTLLTIGIPTYNSADFLSESLGKIREQLTNCGNEVQVLICDNASTDNTEEIAHEFTTADPLRFKYVRHSSNLGMDQNFWSVISMADGQYVHIHADDDFYTPGALERLLAVLKSRDFDAVVLSNNYLNTLNGRIMPNTEESDDILCERDGEKFFLNESLKTLCVTNIVVNRERSLAIPNIERYYGCNWLHIAILTELVKPESSTYIFSYRDPIMTVRLGNQKWLDREGGIAYFYSALVLFKSLTARGYSKRVFDHFKLLFTPLVMNGGALNFTSVWKNLDYCVKFLSIFGDSPIKYLGFCARLLMKKHRPFFTGWEKMGM